MSRLILKTLVFCITLAFISSQSTAQPADKARERIQMMKKMKLIEIMDLEEEKLDEFITQYAILDKQIEESRIKFEEHLKKLQEKLKAGISESDLKNLNQECNNKQKAYFQAISHKNTELQKKLDPKNYAKLMIFEDQFHKEIQRMIFKRYRKEKGGRDRFHGD